MTVSLERYVAIDCEMVGCRHSQALARVAVVNHAGDVLYHSYVFVHPSNVKDYRTASSGIRPQDLDGAPKFEDVKRDVKALLVDKIVVGHALFNDLAAVQHRHVYEDVRDTALYYPLRERMGVVYEGQYPSLRSLSQAILGREIQCAEHCPIEDARATMQIFLAVREQYESSLAAGEDVISGVPSSFAKWYW